VCYCQREGPSPSPLISWRGWPLAPFVGRGFPCTCKPDDRKGKGGRSFGDDQNWMEVTAVGGGERVPSPSNLRSWAAFVGWDESGDN